MPAPPEPAPRAGVARRLGEALALRLVRLSARPVLALAALRMRGKDRAGARDLLARALARMPEDARLRATLDRVLARLHQELGQPIAALIAARAVLGRAPGDVAAAEIAVRSAHRLERHREAEALVIDTIAAAGLAPPRDGAAIARLLLAAGRIDEAAAAARAATPGPESWPVELDAAHAWGNYAAAEGAAARLATLGPLRPRHRRMADEILRARRIVPDPAARFPEALFERAFERPSNRDRTATDTIVLASSTLANAGAERQTALTARLVAEARSHMPGAETVLLARSLDPARGYAARRALAETRALAIENLAEMLPATIYANLVASGAPDDDLALIAAFPERLSNDILGLYARFRALNPRVVHLWQDGTIAVGAVAAVLAGVPRIVGAIRNVLPAEGDRRRAAPWLLPMYRALARRDDVTFVANSHAGAEDYAGAIGLYPAEIAVVHNGVDLSAVRAAAGARTRGAIRAELGVPADAPLVGGAFRFARQKRPELWLHSAALAAVRMPEARFVIFGDGVMRAEMEALAEQAGLGGRLVFAGTRDPIEPWLAALDLFLLCSAQEGLPNALLEAQALGVPAVITPAGGSAEAIADGVSGVIVPSAAPEDLARAVVELVRDPARRVAMAAAAPDVVVARFGLDRMLAQTLALYG